MADTSKKQTFLHGAALLAIATAVVKVIGAFYKLPLNEVLTLLSTLTSKVFYSFLQ